MILLEVSVRELIDNVISVRKDVSLHNMRVFDVNILPMKGVRTLLVTAMVTSQTGVGSYKVSFQFKNVQFADKKDRNTLHVRAKGYDFYFYPVTGDHDVNVRCSCPDFRYRWGYYDQVNKALLGPRYPPPRSKTRPANPWKIPGVCKHIMKVAEFLVVNRIMKW